MMLDPIKFFEMCWPEDKIAQHQIDIMYSVRDNDETYVPAGNGLGKDWTAGLTALWFLCAARPSRVVTTSVKNDQLDRVLWGEIRRFINRSVVKLPIQYNHMHIRGLDGDGRFVDMSELDGQVVSKGEALLGRHLARGPNYEPRTLVIFDEASGIPDTTYISSNTWAHRKLIIGNCWPCANFFKRGVKAGDLKSPMGNMYRKVIRVRAVDSPNVKLAMKEIEAGQTPSNTILIPGMIDWPTYQRHRTMMDEHNQCVSLDGDWYEGAEILLYPPDWLNKSEILWESLEGRQRKAMAIGIDPAEGGDKTCMAAVDEFGLIELVSKKTKDTADITAEAVAFMKKHRVRPEMVLFDRGGGGKQHADRMNQQGYKVKTVTFSESPTVIPKRAVTLFSERTEVREIQTVFKNKRAEMYWQLRLRMDPSTGSGFAISPKELELRRQLSLMPLKWDIDGRFYMLPKNKRKDDSPDPTLTEILGCSPDESDAVILANYAMMKPFKRKIGAF